MSKILNKDRSCRQCHMWQCKKPGIGDCYIICKSSLCRALSPPTHAIHDVSHWRQAHDIWLVPRNPFHRCHVCYLIFPSDWLAIHELASKKQLWESSRTPWALVWLHGDATLVDMGALWVSSIYFIPRFPWLQGHAVWTWRWIESGWW